MSDRALRRTRLLVTGGAIEGKSLRTGAAPAESVEPAQSWTLAAGAARAHASAGMEFGFER